MFIKVYLNISSRILISYLSMAKQTNLIMKVSHFNTVLNYFNDKKIRFILRYLIGLSALLLVKLEKRFPVDSTGIFRHQ